MSYNIYYTVKNTAAILENDTKCAYMRVELKNLQNIGHNNDFIHFGKITDNGRYRVEY